MIHLSFTHTLMKKLFLLCFLSAWLSPLLAADSQMPQTPMIESVQAFIKNMVDANAKYAKDFDSKIAPDLLKKQTPMATVVLCADSRIDLDAMGGTPAGEVFLIRNIGNQIETAKGSVEYGVEQLHTPLLLIIGHSGCGAIAAGMEDFSHHSPDIQKELESLHLNPAKSLADNILQNIDNQVKIARNDFREKVEKDELTIIGMVYDIHDSYGRGNGKLLIVDINGDQDPKKIAEYPCLKGVIGAEILGLQAIPKAKAID